MKLNLQQIAILLIGLLVVLVALLYNNVETTLTITLSGVTLLLLVIIILLNSLNKNEPLFPLVGIGLLVLVALILFMLYIRGLPTCGLDCTTPDSGVRLAAGLLSYGLLFAVGLALLHTSWNSLKKRKPMKELVYASIAMLCLVGILLSFLAFI